MTREEYIEKKDTLLKKRLSLFNKMHKIDNQIKGLDNEYISNILSFKEGDKFIATGKGGQKEYLKVDKIRTSYVSNGKEITELRRYVTVYFKRLNENWRQPRRWDWCREWDIDLHETNNYELPTENWAWEKIND